MFDWDDENTSHIAEHGITPEEAEEALLDPHRRPAGAYSLPGERRWAVIGATEAGRLLFVVFTRRGGIRIVMARNAESRERRRYRR